MEAQSTLLIFLSLILATLITGHPHSEDVLQELDHETHLYFHLLNDHVYVRHLRPASGDNDTVVVTVDLTLTSVQELNEADQQLHSTIVMLLTWQDPRLRWNISDFGGLLSVTLPSVSIWRPNVKLLHSQYGSFEHFDAELVQVFSNGAVSWSTHARVKSYCPLNLQQFPFDVQVCNVDLGTNIYSAKQIHLQFPSSGLDVSMSQSLPITNMNSQWTLVSRRVEGRLGKGMVPPDSLELLRLSVTLQRRAAFYQCVLLGPAVILALLVPAIFLLPVDSATKATVGMLIIAVLAVCLRNLSDVMGNHRASVPRIAVFYVVTMALAGISVLMGALVSTIARSGPTRRAVPTWLSKLFLGRCGLRRVLCLEPYTSADSMPTFSAAKTNPGLQENESDMTSLKDGDVDIRGLSNSLRQLVGRYHSEQAVRLADTDWREVARVLDRLLFFFFVFLFMLTSIAILS